MKIEVYTQNSIYAFNFKDEVVQGGILSELPQRSREFETLWLEDDCLGFTLKEGGVSYKTSPVKKIVLYFGGEKLFLVPPDIPGIKKSLWGIFFKKIPDSLKV